MIKIDKLSNYAPLVLRLGLAYVFIWFGVSCLTDADSWTILVPDWTAVFGPATTLVMIHGVVELLGALCLLVGWQIRWVSAILFLILLDTIIILGSGPSAVRDIGLAAGLLTLWLWDTKQVRPELVLFEKRDKH